jgi:hypothetical protein
MHDAIHEQAALQLGIDFDGRQALIAAMHEHSTPDTTGLWGVGFGTGRDEEYIAMLRDQTVAAVIEAIRNLEDVSIAWGQSESTNNSLSDTGYLDDDLFILQGTRPADAPGGAKGSTVFTLTRWAAHPTAYGSGNTGISADWVGCYRKKMEDTYGGMAVYMNGCIGDVYPDRPSTCGVATPYFDDGFRSPGLTYPDDYMVTTCAGLEVAGNADKALAASKPLAATGLKFRTSMFSFHPDNALLEMLAQSTPLPITWCDVDDPTSLMYSTFSWVTLGDLDIITTPGESFPVFGVDVKTALTAAGHTHNVVLGLTQDWMGYLMSATEYADPAFSYNQSLSPGAGVEAAYLAQLATVIAADGSK